MEEMEFKQRIKSAYSEPRPSEELLQSVTQRVRAVTLGRQAQQELLTAPPEKQAQLVALGLIGQLAAVAPLPADVHPRQLAQQLCAKDAFAQILQGGNLPQRLSSGELMRQLTGRAQEAPQTPREPEEPELIPEVPQKQGPML